MSDAELDSLRDALAPERDATQRLGAAYVAIATRSEDDRIDGLIRSLLQDSDITFAAGLAAMCWPDKALHREFERELERMWALNRGGYRAALLEAAATDAATLSLLGERISRDPDSNLRISLAVKLHEAGGSEVVDALLLLTHDDEAEVVVAALRGLETQQHRAFQAVLARLIHDQRSLVLAAALPLAATHLAREEIKSRVEEIMSGDDLELRILAADLLAKWREEENLARASALAIELGKAVDGNNRELATDLSQKIALLVPRHPEVEYQGARMAAKDGDARRALVTLHHLSRLGAEWCKRAAQEEDFLSLHGIAAWQEVIKGA